MTHRFHGLTAIHCSVFLMGGAGLFGKLLTLSPIVIVFGRTLVASITLAILLPLLKLPVRYRQKKDLLIFFLMGIILALHWITFFHAIQIATVAVGLISFSTFPIFVTFMEPFFFGERLQLKEIVVSFVVFAGLFLVVPEFDLTNNVTLGVFWGTVSGFTFALLAILNRRYVSRYPSLTLALYQDLVACLIVMPFAVGALDQITQKDFGLLVLLGMVFTAGAHSLYIQGMQAVKAQLASVVACLEPLYAILLALLILNEVPSMREIVGGVVIVGTVYYATRSSHNPA